MELVNKNATKEAKELYDYLWNIKNKKIITGQHTQTRCFEEIEHIKNLTGFKPLLFGFELLGCSPNINKASDEVCLKEVRENEGTMIDALEFEGIITLTWHWFSPLYGKGKSFYAEHTEFDPRKVLIESDERKAFYSDMEHIAKILEQFKKRNKPILWRPFHEADGKWFWWGSKGDEVGKELYKLMFNFFVHVKHLDNLIWVWNSPKKEGYPGDEYVDIISQDIYTDKHKKTDYYAEYQELIKNTTDKKIVALAECGVIPDIELLEKHNFPWTYFMTWSKEFIVTEEYNYNEEIIKMYSSKNSLKLGEK